MNTAIHIAKQIIERVIREGDAISSLKLQKLLYYSHGWTLALEGDGLFSEYIEAWKDGPVHSVYREFSRFSASGIINDDTLQLNNDPILDAVVMTYGGLLASMLRNQTHRESPWLDWYDGTMRQAIPHEAIRNFFLEQRDAPSFPIHQKFLDTWLGTKYGAVYIDTTHFGITDEEYTQTRKELGLA